MNNKNIPINKGNYNDMETEYRIKLFNDNRALGWEDEFWEYRKNWTELPLKQKVIDYPLQVDAELSNVCNLKCHMCFRRKVEYEECTNIQFMDVQLYKKIIDEISGKVPALRLSLRGESTLHPNFVECIKYAKDNGIKEVSFLTNISTMTKTLFEKILSAGADWITISVDGLNDTYEGIRKPLKFKDTLQKIKDIKAIKEESNAKRPVIKIQSIWPAIRDNHEEFYNTLAPYVDLIAFNPEVDFFAEQKSDEIMYLEEFACPQLYQRLLVGADGVAMMCSNDDENSNFIGDANKSTIHEIWHSRELNKIREIHKQIDGFKTVEVCKRCYLPQKISPTEHGIVNGREFDVWNYVIKP